MSETTPGEAARAAALALAFSALPLAPLGLYLWQQGAFDPPRVRLTRLITGNDAAALAVARAIEQRRTPEEIEAETGVVLDDGGAPSTTLLWYLTGAFGWDSPRAAYFDWKDGCEQVCPALDAMLADHGITARPNPAEIIADEALHAEEWSAMPVVWAHYAPLFAANDLQLLTLDPQGGWDAYYIFVTPEGTARRWSGTVIEEGENAGLEIHAIPAPTAAITTPEGLTTALAEVTASTDGPRKPPLLAGLPLTELF
ncbi:MAG: hypothetical protein JXQ91_01620 [Vannielia sp.]|uniref:DUF6630 family protein n=1 Tax=Vannielia sp. TaxID=2813045 RepID=UPI003B8C75F8